MTAGKPRCRGFTLIELIIAVVLASVVLAGLAMLSLPMIQGQIKSVNAKTFDYSCQSPCKMYDMNLEAQDDVTPKFVDYTKEANLTLVNLGLTGLGAFLPEGTAELVAAYPDSLICDAKAP